MTSEYEDRGRQDSGSPNTGSHSGSGLTVQSVSRTHRGNPAIADSVHRATADFALARLHCVVGGPGDGNTTLLLLIAGFEAPDTGTVAVGGELVKPATGAFGIDARRVGVVLPTATLLAHLTVLENLILASQLAGRTTPDHLATAERIAANVGISSASLARLPGRLSPLDQGLVCLARALAGDPPVVIGNGLADKLDQRAAERLFDALAGLAHRDGRAVIVMTASTTIARHADEVWFMRSGVLLPATM